MMMRKRPKSGALFAQKAAQHASAPESTPSQELTQSVNRKGVMQDGAISCHTLHNPEMEAAGIEQSHKSLGNSHTATNAAHKQAQLATVPKVAAHADQQLTDIVNIWPILTESERNRAHKIALDASTKRGAN
jgi:hypothetical protein